MKVHFLPQGGGIAQGNWQGSPGHVIHVLGDCVVQCQSLKEVDNT
jgi:hypothetical protein